MEEETIDAVGVGTITREQWGGRESRRQMIKLVALNIKDTGWLSPLIHQ